METNTKTIIIKRPYLVYNITCPHCKTANIKSTSAEVYYVCETCNKKLKSTAYLELYSSYTALVLDALRTHDHVVLSGIREEKSIINLTPKSQWEDDLLNCLLRFQHTFKCNHYQVSEVSTGKVNAIDTVCNNCRICHSCVTCSHCGEIYKPKYPKVVCPKCKCASHKATIVKDPKAKICPHCNSSNLSQSIIKSENKECPNCGSKNIKKPNLLPSYQLTISHQLRFQHQP